MMLYDIINTINRGDIMSIYGLTVTVSTIANALATKLTVEETAFLAALFVQIGDTLATIAAQRTLKE